MLLHLLPRRRQAYRCIAANLILCEFSSPAPAPGHHCLDSDRHYHATKFELPALCPSSVPPARFFPRCLSCQWQPRVASISWSLPLLLILLLLLLLPQLLPVHLCCLESLNHPSLKCCFWPSGSTHPSLPLRFRPLALPCCWQSCGCCIYLYASSFLRGGANCVSLPVSDHPACPVIQHFVSCACSDLLPRWLSCNVGQAANIMVPPSFLRAHSLALLRGHGAACRLPTAVPCFAGTSGSFGLRLRTMTRSACLLRRPLSESQRHSGSITVSVVECVPSASRPRLHASSFISDAASSFVEPLCIYAVDSRRLYGARHLPVCLKRFTFSKRTAAQV